MTNSGDDDVKRGPRLALPTSYDVGYGRPPVSTRFQPGQSGNPRGRPKESKNRRPALSEERLKSIVIEEAYRTIKVRDGARNVSVPMATAIIRALAVNAARGNNRAALLFSTLLQTTERENRALQDQWFDTALTYKIEWEKELARRRRLGIAADDPLPHPDDVVINVRTGKVTIIGPMNREEKELWAAARELKVDLRKTIANAERKLKRTTNPAERQKLGEVIAENNRLVDRIEKFIPERQMFDNMR
jgi:hypothetical protein